MADKPLQAGDLVTWKGKDGESFYGEILALTTVDQRAVLKRYQLREDGQLLPVQSSLVSVPLPKLKRTTRSVYGGQGTTSMAQMSDSAFIEWGRRRAGLAGGSVADLSGGTSGSSEPSDEEMVAALRSGRDGSGDVGTPVPPVAADFSGVNEDDDSLEGVSDEEFLQTLKAVRNGGR